MTTNNLSDLERTDAIDALVALGTNRRKAATVVDDHRYDLAPDPEAAQAVIDAFGDNTPSRQARAIVTLLRADGFGAEVVATDPGAVAVWFGPDRATADAVVHASTPDRAGTVTFVLEDEVDNLAYISDLSLVAARLDLPAERQRNTVLLPTGVPAGATNPWRTARSLATAVRNGWRLLAASTVAQQVDCFDGYHYDLGKAWAAGNKLDHAVDAEPLSDMLDDVLGTLDGTYDDERFWFDPSMPMPKVAVAYVNGDRAVAEDLLRVAFTL